MNKMKNKNALSILWLITGVILLTMLDQWTKYLAVTFLKNQHSIPLIPGVLELQYLENTGAAFGMLKDMQWLFYILTVAMAVVIVWLYFKMPHTGRYLPARIISIVLLAGALGNFIDRIRFQYVVDFIYFSLINFPIFNVADIYVTVSVAVILVLVLFFYKDEDYDFLKKKAENYR
ncbi:MAG: signal peptidase II [Lachnospiraceae bacterium]|nr:signal peptidase II [Lachnospiraceae bacterium]